jgi:4-hydroxy-4-methyl-2-oxoglutarate aldolase
MPSPTLLDRLARFDTNTVSDALDFLGLAGATVGLRPLWDCPKIVGRASTIQLGPKADAAPNVHLISPVTPRSSLRIVSSSSQAAATESRAGATSSPTRPR